jgi:hypothetical protein
MVDGIFRVVLKLRFERAEFQQVNAFERPAVRFGDLVELFRRFRQSDI